MYRRKCRKTYVRMRAYETQKNIRHATMTLQAYEDEGEEYGQRSRRKKNEVCNVWETVGL